MKKIIITILVLLILAGSIYTVFSKAINYSPIQHNPNKDTAIIIFEKNRSTFDRIVNSLNTMDGDIEIEKGSLGIKAKIQNENEWSLLELDSKLKKDIKQIMQKGQYEYISKSDRGVLFIKSLSIKYAEYIAFYKGLGMPGIIKPSTLEKLDDNWYYAVGE